MAGLAAVGFDVIAVFPLLKGNLLGQRAGWPPLHVERLRQQCMARCAELGAHAPNARLNAGPETPGDLKWFLGLPGGARLKFAEPDLGFVPDRHGVGIRG